MKLGSLSSDTFCGIRMRISRSTRTDHVPTLRYFLFFEPRILFAWVNPNSQMGRDRAKQLRDAASVLNKHSATSEKPKMAVQDAIPMWVEYFTMECIRTRRSTGNAWPGAALPSLSAQWKCYSGWPSEKIRKVGRSVSRNARTCSRKRCRSGCVVRLLPRGSLQHWRLNKSHRRPSEVADCRLRRLATLSFTLLFFLCDTPQ